MSAASSGLSVEDVERARLVAEQVRDPELPVLTLADLGVLRGVCAEAGRVVVTITPTYSGCPALDEMRADLRSRLAAEGFPDAEVRTALSPAWTTDWISEEGRRKLAEHGIAPPARLGPRAAGPVPLRLDPPSATVPCPRCGSPNTVELSRFGATACKALRRCQDCREPFEHVKEI
ncbi:ring-1,2-phenylacetyl-CoA epoxidase subunit PaaD [Streptoalloteichus tenebrarius]|uniref:Ring-1,2-phenylacetyl-CoA epoxidase subunit PaaD n=1 Tax=Streptoalloteichus tenebrarius (strain ATCC 17920 / DSM 40477 / JCM 4838 / CBS 697.72 / NBRC 16177 / NCIMB 11028 / NRRL B-12390 / A12253. 1 / ISP 5477) TaxID=1933 RepID=A0ABT1HY42_STRSD|nr:1,2-phenylacetyl-CoA epoxidase subunit PaaD [Streptoalloteichus tenebrarius]MCP2260415.1 ring-1,2-phenylacetyl-CoA epoxidase subunit PaaD [Streptoalloteichus tenebrarius]